MSGVTWHGLSPVEATSSISKSVTLKLVFISCIYPKFEGAPIMLTSFGLYGYVNVVD